MKRFLLLAMLLVAPAMLLGCHYHGHGRVRSGYYVEHHRPGHIYIGGRWVVDGSVEHRHYVKHKRFPQHSPPHHRHHHPPRPPHRR